MPRLENWYIEVIDPSRLSEDTKKSTQQILWGDVYDHPRFEDGTNVHTSLLMHREENKIRTFSGSLYELGEPRFDDTVETLLDSLPVKPE